MKSFFSQLYTDLQQHILTSVPDIKWVEQDLAQDEADFRPNVAFPAVLIDFTSADYEDLGQLAQTATVEVQLRLLVATYSQSYSSAPDNVKEQALQYFELEHELIEAVHGFSSELYQPLGLRSIRTQNRPDIGLRIRTLTFATAYQSFQSPSHI